MILIDTNVLVYAVNSDAPQHAACRRFLDLAQTGRLRAVLLPQVLLEFCAIATDPRRCERPLNIPDAMDQVMVLRSIFPLLDAGTRALDSLPGVLAEYESRGGGMFDAYLVAQMRALGIPIICTYNVQDFARYRGVVAQLPEDLVAGGVE